MKLYLAGPMRGVPDYNCPMFDRAAARLRDLGHEVFSPPEQDRAKGLEVGMVSEISVLRRQAFKEDTAYICDEAEAVVMLPGWESSKGARAENALAVAIGITVICLAEDFLK